MPPLTSVRNARVRQLAGLARRRNRAAAGLHLADGPHAVQAALDAGIVEELFATDRFSDELRARHDVAVTTVSDNVLAHIAHATTPQGVVAVVRTPHVSVDEVFDAASAGRPTVLALDRINDPGNLGAMVRTAAAMGVRGLVLTPECTDPFGPKVVRAAAGATYRLPIATAVAPATIAHAAHQRGGQVVGLDMRAPTTVSELHGESLVVLVAGSEAHGHSDEMRAHVDMTATIPMPGAVESLNVGIAVAIALYERCARP